VVRGALVLLVATLSAASASAAPWQAVASRRALETYGAMERYFYVATRSSYDGTYPPKGLGYAQLWPYTQALTVTLEIAELTQHGTAREALRRGIATLAAYRAPRSGQYAYAPLYGGNGNPFYDDNNWAGLALVSAADLLHERAELNVAQRLLAWIRRGWAMQANVCRGGVYWLMPGGKYWNRSPRSRYRTSVSTLNAALLGVLLFQRTHMASDLRWGEKAYAWTRRCLGTTDGLVADHIDANGNITSSIHSYNEGAAIATAVALYRATHKHRYLVDAIRTADASIRAFHDPLATGDNVSMLAIYYRDLLTLAPLARSAEIHAAISAFGDETWSNNRSPTTGLFQFGETYSTLLDQAAMVQIYAELARS
jgi:Glycosyl hydrolase family 76